MSKWRPTYECIYAIGDIHGNANCLDSIFDRILPLRLQDKIVFLGDYIDRGPNSCGVLDKLIDLKKEYGEQIICIRGNHEQLLLEGLGYVDYKKDAYKVSPFSVWMMNGGDKCIASYLSKGIENILALKPQDVKLIIKKDHIDFLLSTEFIKSDKDFIYVHAGCNPMLGDDEQDPEVCVWNRSLFDFAIKSHLSGYELPWDKTVVCGHHYAGPVVIPKFLMIDTSKQKKLLVLELNSMEAFYAKAGQKRLIKTELIEMSK